MFYQVTYYEKWQIPTFIWKRPTTEKCTFKRNKNHFYRSLSSTLFIKEKQNKTNSLPSSSQKEKTQGHVMGQVETIVHLSTRLHMQIATELQHLQVPRASHYHGKSQQDNTQTGFEVVGPCLVTQKHDSALTVIEFLNYQNIWHWKITNVCNFKTKFIKMNILIMKYKFNVKSLKI